MDGSSRSSDFSPGPRKFFEFLAFTISSVSQPSNPFHSSIHSNGRCDNEIFQGAEVVNSISGEEFLPLPAIRGKSEKGLAGPWIIAKCHFGGSHFGGRRAKADFSCGAADVVPSFLSVKRSRCQGHRVIKLQHEISGIISESNQTDQGA